MSSGSGSGSDSVSDERKRKRMQSNRDSARRSRLRKQQRLDDLINQVTQFNSKNAEIAAHIEAISCKSSGLESENAVMRRQLVELTERLKSVNSVLRFVEEFSGMDVDIPDIPDPLLRPWKLPSCPSHPVLASTHHMFWC